MKGRQWHKLFMTTPRMEWLGAQKTLAAQWARQGGWCLKYGKGIAGLAGLDRAPAIYTVEPPREVRGWYDEGFFHRKHRDVMIP